MHAQVRMRALLQVVAAWACGGDGASARTAAEALGGSPGLMWVGVEERCVKVSCAGSRAIPASRK